MQATMRPIAAARSNARNTVAPRRAAQPKFSRNQPPQPLNAAKGVTYNFADAEEGDTEHPLRPSETAESREARRQAETKSVDDRMTLVTSQAELDKQISDAGDRLVMLAVESNFVCDMGDEEWTAKDAVEATNDAMAPCKRLHGALTRVMRACDSVVFLQADGDDAWPELQAETLPTFRYYMNGKMVWEHSGASSAAATTIGEAMLYYDGQGAAGLQSSDWIEDINSEESLDAFLSACSMPQTTPGGAEIDVECSKQLAVVDVSLLEDSPESIKIFPAVLALAQNLAGAVRFARLEGDASPEAAVTMRRRLNVTEAPCFIFFCEGKEVARYTGIDRGRLTQAILGTMADNDVPPPLRPRKKRLTNAEVREIAKQKRKAESAKKAAAMF